MILDKIPRLVPMRPELYGPLKAAAAADNHLVLPPTHVVLRGQEVVGYGSIGGLPLVNVWLKTGEVKARESIQLLATAEAIAASQGMRMIYMPCATISPFYPHLEELGFSRLGATTANLKDLTK